MQFVLEHLAPIWRALNNSQQYYFLNTSWVQVAGCTGFGGHKKERNQTYGGDLRGYYNKQ